MKRIRSVALAGAVVVVALGVGLQTGIAQQAAPTENKGFKAEQLVLIDLAQDQGIPGRQFRFRKITLEPGGVIAVHEHKDRPAIDYVLQGTVIDHRGSEAKEYGPGTTLYETKDTVHWLETKGNTAAVVISADILKQ